MDNSRKESARGLAYCLRVFLSVYTLLRLNVKRSVLFLMERDGTLKEHNVSDLFIEAVMNKHIITGNHGFFFTF